MASTPMTTEPTGIPEKEAHDVVHMEEVADDQKSTMDYDRIDPEVAKYTTTEIVEIDEATNRRLKRMIDRRVLVFMTCTYFLQAIDKGTLAFSSIMGIQNDTGLVGQQYAWLTTCIYIAILIMEYPINWTIQRVPIAKFLSFNIVAWGTVLCCHAACRNFAGLVTVRTLLGIFEATCQPIFVVLSAMWYRREEQALTVSIWYMMNGGQQIVGGVLAYAFTNITHSPLKSWQALFLAYGLFSILFGIIVGIFMPDSPMRAKCFSEEDKRLMVERVRANQTGLQNRQFRKDQAIEAFKDPQVWCYGLVSFLTTLPTSGLGAFANIIITGLGFTVLQTQLLAMVLGAYIIIVLLSSAWLTKRFGNTVLIMGIYVIPSIVGTIVLMAVENHNLATKAGLLCSYYLALSFWATSTLDLSLLSRNVGGQTKKSAAVALNFVLWATGNAIGPQVFQANDAPRYFKGFAAHLVCYIILLFILAFLRWYLKRQNAKKAALLASMGESEHKLTHSFEDLTDVQNPYFVDRYLVNITDNGGAFLLELADGSVVDTKGWNDWEWTHGVGLYGLWRYYELTGNEKTLEIIKSWFRGRFADPPRNKNINTMAALLTLAYVYEKTGDQTYLPHLEAWADYVMYDLPRTEFGGFQHITYASPNTQQLWDDTLMMTVLPLAKIGKLLNRAEYIEVAKYQFLIHFQYLKDTRTGLFYHGWCFENGGHNYAKALWARGNSWITIVIPEIIELLNLLEGDHFRTHLIQTFLAQIRALEAHQDKSTGLWHTLIDDLGDNSYLEASATAGFAFGILKALRKHYIPAEERARFQACADRAVKGVINHIDADGELQQTSFGTPVFDSLDEYKQIQITSMPYGQAMAIMCLVEELRRLY